MQADVIEKLEQHITEPQVGQVHYLSHRPIIRNDKQTSKVRTVYGASSYIRNNTSLIDCLLPGPLLTVSLLSVLIQFRLNRYVFSADTEKHSYKSYWKNHIVILSDFKDLDDLCSAKIKDPKNIAVYRVGCVLFGL